MRKRSVLAVLVAVGLSFSCFNGYSGKLLSRADEDTSAPTVDIQLPSEGEKAAPVFEPDDPEESAPSDDAVPPPESDTSAPDQDTTPSEPDPFDSAVAIDEKNFPDKVFRECVAKYDANGNGKLEEVEAANITKISLRDCEVESVQGIEYLTALTSLDVTENKLKSLDVSKNTKLTFLECHENQLTSLDVSMLSELTTLGCSYNQITTLNIGNITKLTSIWCYNNKISSLDVSKLSDLTILYCASNLISSIDVSKNLKLESLICANCKLQKLDVSKNLALRHLGCGDNNLSSLDVSMLPKLSSLGCGNNLLTKLDVSMLSELTGLDCGGNKLTSLNVTKNPKLYRLTCYENQLTGLDVSKNPELRDLECYKNAITSLDISNCDGLYCLLTHGNKISKLNVSNCKSLVNALSYAKVTDQGSYYMIIDPDKGDPLISFDKTTQITPEFQKPTATPSPMPLPTEPEPSPTAPPPPPSNSGFEKFVERLYKIALNREPEPEGKAFWVKHVVEDGATGAECARFFLLDAPEFMNRKLSNEQFIDTLYSVFFDRAAEEGGKAYWLGQLKAGTPKSNVVNGFIESTEWCNVCASFGVKSGAVYHKATVPSANAKAFATRLYTCCLGRAAEDAGLKYWSLALTNLEKNAAEAASLFFNSEEFIGFETTNTEYLRRLYLTFMDREADQGGLEYWLSQLGLGVSRQAILKQFAESPEFTALCKQYGIERGTLPQPPSRTKTTITVMSMANEVENMIKDYLKKHPDLAAKYDFVFTYQNNDGQAYEHMLNNALQAGGPDIYVVEADYAFEYVKGAYSSYAAPYSKIFSDFSERLRKADPASYTISMGTNLDDQIVGLAYQATGGVFIYRRSIAKAVFGSDSPDVVGKAIGAGTNSWDTFLKAADTLNKKGYSIVSSNGDIWNVVDKAAKTPWVIDGKLNIDPIRSNFMDLSKTIIDKGYSNDSFPWTESWYADMRGEGARGVLGFFGPAWLVNYVISYTCTEAATGYGDWAVCESPYPFWWGGSWLLANRNVLGTEKQAVVAEILNYITLDTSKDGAQYKWATGAFDFTECCDTVASNTVMKSVSIKWPFLGNQNPYPVFANASAKASASSYSAYNVELNGTFMDLCNQYAHGQLSKEDAIHHFMDRAEDIGIEIG